MARFLRSACLFLVRFSWGFLAPAEQTQANDAHADTGTLRLGSSTIALNGPWKFQIGDSPIDSVTHERLWAEPGF